MDKVIARLEGAALTTARSMQEISHHWDAVYEAMRRAEHEEDALLDKTEGSQPKPKA